MSRSDVEFRSDGVVCRGWLYVPDGVANPPVIVMAHGLGAVKEMRLDAFAERFADAGYAALVFDYRHFGASEGLPRQLLSIRRQLDDWAAAIAYARSLPQVDGNRVILWGTSFAGGHVMVAGARDGHVQAVIAQCPFTSGLASTLAMDFRTAAKVTTRALLDLAGTALGREPVRVGTAGPEHAAALMTAPDVVPGYLGMVPPESTFVNEVAARIGLSIPLARPGRKLRDITCPTLVCVCDNDSVAPPGPTITFVEGAPNAEMVRYPEGHFDIYVGDAFEKVIADQVDFLDRTVPAN